MTLRRLVIVAGDFVATGGMDRANHALARAAVRRGIRVELAAHRIADDLRGLPGIHFHRAAKPFDSYTLGRPFLAREGARRVAHARAAGAHAIANGGNCRGAALNWIHYVHAAWEPPPKSGLRGALTSILHQRLVRAEHAALTDARVIIANSQRTAQDLRDHAGVAPERVRVVYYGTDRDCFRPFQQQERASARAVLGITSEQVVIGFVGSAGDPRKGFGTVLSAWRRLQAQHKWKGVLLIAGHGSAAGGAEGVRYLGLRHDMDEVYRACDVLLAPSAYEAYGLAVHEALCCGVPAIVARHAGVSERYPPELQHLLLDSVDDVDAIVDTMLHWRERQRVDACATVALSDVLRRHSWDDMAGEILDLMDAV